MAFYTLDDLPDHVPKDFIALTSEEDLLPITKPLREKWGITYFAHVISFDDGRVSCLVNQRDVALHWITHNYFIPGNDHQGGHIPSGYYYAPAMGKLFPPALRESLVKLFNIDHMFSISYSYRTYSEVFSFGAEPDNAQIINFYFNNLHVLRSFIVFYKEKAKDLIKKTMGEGIMLSPAPKIAVYPTNLISAMGTGFSSKKIQIKDKVYLTPREIECLILISKGKTAKEAANILHLSPRTVEDHLAVSKEKLDCYSKSELIEKFHDVFDENSWLV